MFHVFGLVLMVNHDCNLRCEYCYTGRKFGQPMTLEIGRKAIGRAVRSIEPGGVLELGFFGGEPLIEAALINTLIDEATAAMKAIGGECRPYLTTNGTLTTPEAWAVMMRPELDLTVSHDGLPTVHDQYRRTADGRGTSRRIEETMRKLQHAGKAYRVNMVLRPDTMVFVPVGIGYLRGHGVTRFDLSIDLWTQWQARDMEVLRGVVTEVATMWRDLVPVGGINWFDEKLLRLVDVEVSETARCGFGKGQVAVSPRGNLYPCERLIGEDVEGNPMRMEGDVWAGEDFNRPTKKAGARDAACASCELVAACSTDCACANYVRTGDASRPDRLLCLLNEWTAREALLRVAFSGAGGTDISGRSVPLRVLSGNEVQIHEESRL